MKKSTLITTIAMIVVVVVALSTATYAWFSSTSKTTASTTISTEAASGIILYGGTYDDGTVTYSSSAPLDWTLPEGIYSPEATLTGTLGSNDSQATYTLVDFYSAKKYPQDAGGVTELPTDSTIDPQFIRVINNTATNKRIVITIYIEVPTGATDNMYKAAAGFVTSIATPTTVYRTAYNFGTVDDTATTGEGAGYYVATKGAGAAITAPASAGQPGVTLGQPSITTDQAIAADGFVATNAAAQSAGLASTSKMRTIIVDLGVLNTKTAINLAFYAWLDGWALEDPAAGVTGLNVVYSFGAEDAA